LDPVQTGTNYRETGAFFFLLRTQSDHRETL
jgi:hypothetical protein